MSRSSQSPALRTVALASALLVAGLAAPAVGHAQGTAPERTLMNRVAVPSVTRAASETAPATPAARGIAGSVDGARALLGLTPAPGPREIDRMSAAVDSALGTRIDGERALLAQAVRAETRRSR
jgi:hypothetical protein